MNLICFSFRVLFHNAVIWIYVAIDEWLTGKKLQLICRGIIIVLFLHSSGRIVENHNTSCPAKTQIWRLPNTYIVPYAHTKLFYFLFYIFPTCLAGLCFINF